MTTAEYDVLIEGSMITGKNPAVPAVSVVVPSESLEGHYKSITIEPAGVFLTDEAGLRFYLDGIDVDASLVFFEGAQIAVCREILMDSDGEVEYPIAIDLAPELTRSSGLTP